MVTRIFKNSYISAAIKIVSFKSDAAIIKISVRTTAKCTFVLALVWSLQKLRWDLVGAMRISRTTSDPAWEARMPGWSGLKSSWHASRAADYSVVYERFIDKEQVGKELSVIVSELTEVLDLRRKILAWWERILISLAKIFVPEG